MNIYLKLAVSLIAFKALFAVITFLKSKNYDYTTFIADMSFLCVLTWIIYLQAIEAQTSESLVYFNPHIF